MAKTIRPVVGGKSKKLNKIYVVVSGVTKVVKKVYAVVNGITKLVWGGEEEILLEGIIKYFRTAPTMSVYREGLKAGSTKDYAVFLGGTYSNDGSGASGTATKYIDAYDIDLVKTSITAESTLSENTLIFEFNECVIARRNNYFHSIDNSLTYSRWKSSDIDSTLYAGTEGLSISDTYMLAPVGSTGDYNIEAIDTSYTQSALITLPTQHNSRAVGKVSKYAIYVATTTEDANGDSIYTDTVRAIDDSITLLSCEDAPMHYYTTGSCGGRGQTADNYVIFCGFNVANQGSSEVFAYSSNLTLVNLGENLIEQRGSLASATLGNYALFAGGYVYAEANNYVPHNTVFYFDPSLTLHYTEGNLSIARYNLAATAIGNYVFVAGGTENSVNTHSNVVDVFKMYKS